MKKILLLIILLAGCKQDYKKKAENIAFENQVNQILQDEKDKAMADSIVASEEAKIQATLNTPPKELNSEEKVIEKELLKKFTARKDEFEDLIWYSHKLLSIDYILHRSLLIPYLSNRGNLYLTSQYAGRDWIFHEQIIVKIGDKKFSSEVIPTYDDRNTTENSSSTLWETIRFTGNSDNGIFKAIAESNNEIIKVRFIGKQNIHDETLNKRNIDAIKDAYKLGCLYIKRRGW